MGTVLWDQTARDVFLTNQKSIKQAQLIIRKGNKDGENCHALILFLKERNLGLRFDVGMLCLDPGSAHEKGAVFKFLWKHHPVHIDWRHARHASMIAFIPHSHIFKEGKATNILLNKMPSNTSNCILQQALVSIPPISSPHNATAIGGPKLQTNKHSAECNGWLGWSHSDRNVQPAH